MTSILIANAPIQNVKVTAKSVEKNDEMQFLCGYHTKDDIKLQQESVLSAIFTSFLTHETIYIKPLTVSLLIDRIGVADVNKLFDNKILKVCFDLDDFVIKLNKNSPSLEPLHFQWSDMEGFEEKLGDIKGSNPKEINKLFQYIDNSSVKSDKETSKLIESEIITDITNPILSNDFSLNSESITNVNPLDFYRLLRVSDVAQGLVLQNKLGIDSIYQDGFSKKYINTKLGAFSSISGKDSIETFSNIMNLKGLPDIFKLYSKGIITVDDILRCRNNFNGSVFRKWFASEDYDEHQVVQSLLNKATPDKGVSKFIRFLYPNLAGIISPVLGAASAAVDSYLVSRVIDGWSPSLFLDDVLKTTVDDKVRIFEFNKKKEQFISRFGSVGRNDPCPCQSGKKYKKCHGK